MKKLLIIVLVLGLVSCKKSGGFLDNQSVGITESQVFTDSARTMQFLIRIYADMGFSFNKGRWSSHGNTELSTDDAEYSFSGVTQCAVALYNGTLSPLIYYSDAQLTQLQDFWNVPYANIRRVNLLLSKLPTTPLSPAVQTRVKGEIKFLRAWYYSQLLISFGGVPNIEDQVFGIDDIINLPRSNFGELVTYLSKELDEAAALLPAPNALAPAGYTPEDYGHITKGACMGLKSRILLYAASPLFNGGSIATDEKVKTVVSYPTYDVKYWQAAADAAKAVINSGYYSLYEDNVTAAGYGFFKVFLLRINSEYILPFNRPANKDMESYYNPSTRGGSKYGMPSENLVRCFPMRNGKDIADPTSGYDPANPYLNREPRFYNSIIYNTSLYWLNSSNSKQPVLTFEGSGTADAFLAGSTTGYFTRKMCDDNTSQGGGANTERCWPLLRYAEIILNYAEAVNELGQVELAVEQINLLRKRAGILPGADNRYGIKSGIVQADMRDLIRNERRVELAFEDHRWHDIRRWKIAVAVNNGANTVMRITRSGTTYIYNPQPSIRKHVFRPEMYLLPVPDQEIRKMPLMVQNPGW